MSDTMTPTPEAQRHTATDDPSTTPWRAGGVTQDRFVTVGTESEGIFSLGDVNIFPDSGPGPVAIAAGADIAASIVEAVNNHHRLTARISELESNERAYEAALGQRTYNEVALYISGLEEAITDLIEAIRRDSDDDGKGISGYTAARVSDARATLSSGAGK